MLDYLQNHNFTFIMDGGNIYLPGRRINNWECQKNVFFKIFVLNCERSVINGYGLDEKYSIRGMSRTFRTMSRSSLQHTMPLEGYQESLPQHQNSWPFICV